MSKSFTEVLRLRLRALRSRALFLQFAGVGLVGATVDTTVLYALVSWTAFGPVAGKTVSWVFGIGVIFAINEWWTFSAYGKIGLRALLRRLLTSYLVRFAGFLVTLAVLFGLVYWFDVWFLLANVIGIGVGFFVNYTCESLYTWKVHRD
ncbi:polysaccharide synthesis protein GtrA [Halostagnicola larsenii XH-48]|uniref:Polysaccharide synthesis protein GtrA n=1 Tax=Halostagnicola larsenii XH-48 TaxID=797299 RepID=W0JPC1_9EURY|nr:GtrA family protein [Halostagnicola larsenii]AHF98822.1 polysaccharide synthesis protein GtrA [Halostagnicola larsenii XH-48]